MSKRRPPASVRKAHKEARDERRKAYRAVMAEVYGALDPMRIRDVVHPDNALLRMLRKKP